MYFIVPFDCTAELKTHSIRLSHPHSIEVGSEEASNGAVCVMRPTDYPTKCAIHVVRLLEESLPLKGVLRPLQQARTWSGYARLVVYNQSLG